MRQLAGVAALLALLAGCASGDAPAGEDARDRYTVEVGDSPVGVIPAASLRDETRGKDLELNIEYPTRGEKHPLIIFSHGFGGSSQSYVSLSSYWSSQGYVVIKPTHADSRRISRGAIESEGPAEWRNRVRDVTVIIDSLAALEQKYPELTGKIDATRIGVGGHSYGALTAMLVGGTKTFPGAVSYADPRVRAIVAMSPQGPADRWGLTRESWAAMRVPALYMTGTLDRGIEDSEDPAWRREAFTLAPSGDQWLVVIQGARHASFTGRLDDVWQEEIERRRREQASTPTRPGERPTDPVSRTGRLVGREQEIFETIRSLSLAFWDAYLRGESSGRELLEKTSRAEVTYK